MKGTDLFKSGHSIATAVATAPLSKDTDQNSLKNFVESLRRIMGPVVRYLGASLENSIQYFHC